MIVCEYCGQRNGEDQLDCRFCGAVLPYAVQTAANEARKKSREGLTDADKVAFTRECVLTATTHVNYPVNTVMVHPGEIVITDYYGVDDE